MNITTGWRMRKVSVSDAVRYSLAELELHLTQHYRMSRAAANSRIDRIRLFLISLGNPGDYAPCRFRKWRALDYRCPTFEGWVFAYEAFEEGVIVRDMAHGKLLDDVIA